MENGMGPVFLISLHVYGTPLALGGSYLALHSSLFGPDGTVNYDYIATNSISSLLMAQDLFPMAHTLTMLSQFGPCFKT